MKSAGIKTEHMDGYQESAGRREAIDRFRNGEITVLSSVACLSIGFDAPAASCLVLARPTKSLTLHLQQIGRGLRPSDAVDPFKLLGRSAKLVTGEAAVAIAVRIRHDLPGGPATRTDHIVSRRRRHPRRRPISGGRGVFALLPAPETGKSRIHFRFDFTIVGRQPLLTKSATKGVFNFFHNQFCFVFGHGPLFGKTFFLRLVNGLVHSSFSLLYFCQASLKASIC